MKNKKNMSCVLWNAKINLKKYMKQFSLVFIERFSHTTSQSPEWQNKFRWHSFGGENDRKIQKKSRWKNMKIRINKTTTKTCVFLKQTTT